MRVTLIAVGRLKPGPTADIFAEYAGRLRGGLGMLRVIEVEARGDLAPAERMRREAALLRASLPKGAAMVALDARGKTMTSEAFADFVARHQRAGRDLAFVIGGAEGLARDLVAAADSALSLGAMTWPHLLVRVLLAEQLFRAQSILAGHPYHRA